MNRRQFFSNIIRWLMGGSFLTLGGLLIYRNKDASRYACEFNPVCKECNLVQSCNKTVKKLREANER